MNWIDRPIEPTKALQRGIRRADPAEIERRRQAILASDRERKSLLTPNERRSATQKQNAKRRKLTARWDTASALQSWSNLPRTVVLEPWHVDSDGCRARAVGCVEA